MESPPPPAMNKDWKYHLGLGLFIYSFFPFFVTLALPLLPLAKSTMAVAATVLIASAEVAFYLGVALLGKPFLQALKRRWHVFWSRYRRHEMAAPRPVSRRRHALGVALCLVSPLPYYGAVAGLVLGYAETGGMPWLVGMLLASEALFVVGLFVLGGEFWERLKKLFAWPEPAAPG